MLLAAIISNVLGLAWLALSMDSHWRQVRGGQPLTRQSVVALRTLGALALAISLFLCLRADHVTMAPLVWVMALAAAALVVAFTLAWRPRFLVPLVAWLSANGNPNG
jgi:hypothetical protein